MCDGGGTEGNQGCVPGVEQRRGDLLLCPVHASRYPVNVGRVEGEIRCWCGGFKPVKQRECGEPCSF